jgi:hypothetical protein
MRKEDAHNIARQVVLEEESKLDSYLKDSLSVIFSLIKESAEQGCFSLTLREDELTRKVKVYTLKSRFLTMLLTALSNKFDYPVTVDRSSDRIKVEW